MCNKSSALRTIIISTIFVLIYIIITLGYYGDTSLRIFEFITIIFLGGVFNEIINKRPRGFFNSLCVWIAIVYYQGFLLFVYVVVFYYYDMYGGKIFIEGILGVASFLAPAIIGFTMICILPLNIVGGIIGFLAKRIKNRLLKR